MAKMIPAILSPDVKSNAEKHIFEWFRNAKNTEDWIVLHSLGLSNHTKVIHGEVDFFVLAPNLGFFSIEVKGGRVSRKDGLWSFTDKYGNTDTRFRGPFDQAWEGMYSILNRISELVDSDHEYLKDQIFGIGVMFPDINYNQVGADQEKWQIFDYTDGTDVTGFINRIAHGFKNKWEIKRGRTTSKNFPTVSDVKYIADLLRGDFDLVPVLKVEMKYAEEKLISLTKEQYKCIDQLEDNPRCVVKGTAGTGKTLIAIEEVKKAVNSGEKVAFLCFNKLLGAWLNCYFQEQDESLRPIFVGTFHKFLKIILEKSGERMDLPQDKRLFDEYYRKILPKKVLECLETQNIIFDRIVIDEAQDIIFPLYLDVISKCLKNGLKNGTWMMFGDFYMQNIYTVEGVKGEELNILSKNTNYVTFKLNVNCRNTMNIDAEVKTMADLPIKEKFKNRIEGPLVQYITYSSTQEQKNKLIELIVKLRENQIEWGEITILSPHRREYSVINELNGLEIRDFSVPKEEKLTFSTIHSFKGLENKVIILVDIENYKDEKIMYVGMSRARTGLYILETEKAHSEYVQLFMKRRLKND